MGQDGCLACSTSVQGWLRVKSQVVVVAEDLSINTFMFSFRSTRRSSDFGSFFFSDWIFFENQICRISGTIY